VGAERGGLLCGHPQCALTGCAVRTVREFGWFETGAGSA
jgi:hypothetical protein